MPVNMLQQNPIPAVAGREARYPSELAAAIKVNDETAINRYREELQLHEVAAKRQRDSVKAIIKKANPGK